MNNNWNTLKWEWNIILHLLEILEQLPLLKANNQFYFCLGDGLEIEVSAKVIDPDITWKVYFLIKLS